MGREGEEEGDRSAMGTYKCCLIFKRRFRWNDAPPPDDVRALFANHSAGGGPHMAADGLRAYLQATGQDGDVDMERLVEQIRQLQGRGGRIPRVGRALPLLTVDDFHRFLFSHELNPPIRHGQGQVHHDMAAPLSHYFIYTGHNSYLTGNQLSSDCSDLPIIRALQRGVRVIELDMWPNSSKDDISILHGRTLTTPVSLLKCLLSIKKHAFEASPYPVIITLEDHLTPDLQDKAAKVYIIFFFSLSLPCSLTCQWARWFLKFSATSSTTLTKITSKSSLRLKTSRAVSSSPPSPPRSTFKPRMVMLPPSKRTPRPPPLTMPHGEKKSQIFTLKSTLPLKYSSSYY